MWLLVLVLFAFAGGSRERVVARAELEHLLARSRALGRDFSSSFSSGLPPVVLVPGIGGTQVEQRFVNAKGPHFFCSTNQDWSRVWLKLSNLVPKVWDCFAARIARSWNGSAWLDQPGVMTRPGQGLDAIAYLDPADFFHIRLRTRL